jgi:hypothetical protein
MKALKGTSMVALVVALFFTPYMAVAQCYTIGCRAFSQSSAGSGIALRAGHTVVDNGGSGGTATCSIPVAPGDTIVIGSIGRAGTSFTVTDSASQTYTPVYFATDSGNPSISGIEYTANSASGSITVSSDAGVSSPYSVIFCQAWYNTNATTPLDSTFSSGFNQTSTLGTVANGNCGTARTPGNANSLVLSLGVFDSATPSVGANYTTIDTSSVTALAAMQYWIQTTATATTGAFVSAADDWSVGCAAFHQ